VVKSVRQSSSAPPQSICGGFFSADGPRRLDDAGATPALPAMGHLGPRFCVRDIAGKIALVYAVALRRMAPNEFGAILAQSAMPKKPVLGLDPMMGTGFRTGSCSIQGFAEPDAARRRAKTRSATLTCIRRQRVSNRSE
jgi:hypothetical protein